MTNYFTFIADLGKVSSTSTAGEFKAVNGAPKISLTPKLSYRNNDHNKST
jgi:hypothetical protein